MQRSVETDKFPSEPVASFGDCAGPYLWCCGLRGNAGRVSEGEPMHGGGRREKGREKERVEKQVMGFVKTRKL